MTPSASLVHSTESHVTVTSPLFDTFTVAIEDQAHFPDGIPGYENCRHFVLLEVGAGLFWLHSTDHGDGAALVLLVVDPFRVAAGYTFDLGPADHFRLGSPTVADVLVLAIVTRDVVQGAAPVFTANLQAPIVVNQALWTGRQCIRNDDLFADPVRFDCAELIPDLRVTDDASPTH